MNRAILQAAMTLLVAATISFFALRLLPGDAVTAQLEQSGASEEDIRFRQVVLGLDKPPSEQYLQFLADLVEGDLGVSLLTGLPVSETILQRLPPTLSLVIPALVIAAVLGIVLGAAESLYDGQLLGKLASWAITLALSVPIAWTATLLIYVFTVQFNMLPSAGDGRVSQLILPVSVLGFHSAGAIARVFAAQVHEMVYAHHVRTARSKGLRERTVVAQHILRPALIPVLTMISLQAGYLFGGTVMTESLFVRPGLGRLLFDSVLQQDYPVVQGIVILSAALYMLMNVAAEFMTCWLDPRINAF